MKGTLSMHRKFSERYPEAARYWCELENMEEYRMLIGRGKAGVLYDFQAIRLAELDKLLTDEQKREALAQ